MEGTQVFVAGIIFVAALPLTVFADSPTQDDSKQPVYANITATNDFVFRGIEQTNGGDALQGEAGYKSDSFYSYLWASRSTWFQDTYPGNRASTEIDLGIGYDWTVGPSGNLDARLVRYQYYPGDYPSLPIGVTNPDTTEANGRFNFAYDDNWTFRAEADYGLTRDYFGTDNSPGAWYFALSGDFKIREAWHVVAHIGRQQYTGTANGFKQTNSSLYSYTDDKLLATFDAVRSRVQLALELTRTNANPAGYTVDGRNAGDRRIVAWVRFFFGPEDDDPDDYY